MRYLKCWEIESLSLQRISSSCSIWSRYIYTVESPNKGHFGDGTLVLCLEVVPISEVHDFSTHFDYIILNKFNSKCTECIIRAVEMIIKWLVCSVFSINTA